MVRLSAFMLLLMSAPAFATAPDSAPGAADIDIYRYALASAIKQASRNELDEAYPALIGVIRSPVFDRLESDERRSALFIAGLVAIDLDQAAEGHALLVRSCAMPQAGGDDWLGRLHAARRLELREDAVESLTQIARRWPEKLQELNFRIVWDIVHYARHVPASERVLHALLDGLYAAKWTLPDGIEPSSMWRDLAALELERGQLTRAREVLRRVQSPHVVISMRIDRRFDRLRAAEPGNFDVDAAVANELEMMRAIVRRSPRSLGAIVQLTYSMLDAGRYDETLETTAAVMRRIEGATAEQAPYDDMDELIWILDNRARALAAAQRWNEAEAMVRAAADRTENGARNVSNIINLAWFYAAAGRNDEALAALLDMGQDMSAYGLMQMHGARYAAALQKGDMEIANESLAYLAEHRNDALQTWQWTLVRANRLDEAAALLIQRLRDPVLRGEALEDVQDYVNPPPASQRAVWNTRWMQVRNRADVRRTVDAVGRIERFSIPGAVD